MTDHELPDTIELTRAEAIGLARILWEVLGSEGVNHDTQMRAREYALDLDKRVLMPPWPTEGLGREQVLEHMRRVLRIVERRLAELGE